MNRTDFISCLRTLGACDEALAWIEQTPGEPKDLWAACQRGDWMLWLLEAVDYDERTMRHIACDFAEGVLPIYERAHPDDRRPHDAIAVARRYEDGEATVEELIATRHAAWDASDAAADYSAYAAARAAAWATAMAAAYSAATEAATAAAKAAAWSAAWGEAKAANWDASCWSAACWSAAWVAAWDAAMSRHADMVRARVSWEDVERAIAAIDAQEACSK